jgi:hypothetical protein
MGDTLQYSRQSYQNRCRLRSPDGWHWISIPLKSGQFAKPINEVEIDLADQWRARHWKSLQFNYRSTPYFEFYEPEVRPFFDLRDDHLASITCQSVQLLVALLDLPVQVVRASEVAGKPATIAEMMEATCCSGLAVLEDERLPDVGRIPVHRLRPQRTTYRQNFDGFEAQMSGLDVLFNLGPAANQAVRSSVAPL